MNSCPHTDACAFCYAALLAEVKSAYLAGWSDYNGSRYATGELSYKAWKQNSVSDKSAPMGPHKLDKCIHGINIFNSCMRCDQKEIGARFFKFPQSTVSGKQT